MYVRPTLAADQPTTFGVSGKLWRSALVMYDRQTLSLWSQIDGQVMAGPSVGRTLDEVPSELTTWDDWRRRHPDTLVMIKPALDGSVYQSYHDRDFVGLPWFKSRDKRLPGKTLVLGVEFPHGQTAVPVDRLDSVHLATFHLGDEPLLALAPESSPSRRVYRRPQHEGVPLDFRWQTDGGDVHLVDIATDSRWDWQSGVAIDGPLKDLRMEAIPASPIYWGIWSRFFPESEIVEIRTLAVP